MDLVRRAVETRHRVHGDVELTHWDDDGAYIQLLFAITTGESNVSSAFEAVRMVVAQVEEAAEQAADKVGKRIAEVAARLSGWGAGSLEQLVNKVETAQSTGRVCDSPGEGGKPKSSLLAGILDLVEWIHQHRDERNAPWQP
jgi:hypothetical protein